MLLYRQGMSIDLRFVGFAAIIAFLYLSVAQYAWRRRTTPGAGALAILMLAAGEYASAYLLTFASIDLPSAKFWFFASLLGAFALPPAWLIFSIQYTRRKEKVSRYAMLLLALLPTLLCLAAWSNSLHGWYGSGWALQTHAGLTTLQWQFGPLFWVGLAYSYLIVATGMVIMIRSAWRNHRLTSTRSLWLMAGALPPILSHLTYSLGYMPLGLPDLTPFFLLFTGVTWLVALTRFQLLNRVPFARERVFDIMPIIAIVLDSGGRVVDANQSAAAYLNRPLRKLIGAPMPADSNLSLTVPLSGVAVREVYSPLEGKPRYLSLHISPIYHPHSLPKADPLTGVTLPSDGALLMLMDITERKLAEQANQQQQEELRRQQALTNELRKVAEENHAWADTLRNAAAALNHSLNLEEVLELTLQNLKPILPYQAAFILVTDPSGQHIRQSFIQYSSLKGEEYSSAFSTFSDGLRSGQPVPASLWNWMQTTPLSTALSRPALPTAQVAFPLPLPSTGAPIYSRGKLIGCLVVALPPHQPLSSNQLTHFNAYINQAAFAIENACLYAELEERAIHDELTGVLNRRGLMENAEREIKRAHRFHHPLGLILFDFDYFKEINDTFGHQVGDEVLRLALANCKECIREEDMLGRYGGDEFLLLLPECSRNTALLVADRLRRAVTSYDFALPAPLQRPGVPLGVVASISVGVAIDESCTRSLSEMIESTDRSLYLAKQSGRNCIRQEEFLSDIDDVTFEG